MYLLSQVLSASDLIVKTARAIRSKTSSCVFAVACATIMLLTPFGAHAQQDANTNAPSEQIQTETQVDINSADAATLALALDGVGMAKAQDIIAYREQNGDFKTVDDLQKVRGIGKATLERNRSRILVVQTEE